MGMSYPVKIDRNKNVKTRTHLLFWLFIYYILDSPVSFTWRGQKNQGSTVLKYPLLFQSATKYLKSIKKNTSEILPMLSHEFEDAWSSLSPKTDAFWYELHLILVQPVVASDLWIHLEKKIFFIYWCERNQENEWEILVSDTGRELRKVLVS